MSGASDWIPLFPQGEIPRILRIVERCASRIQKVGPLERENNLSDRLRDLIDRDAEFREGVDAELQREVPIYNRKKPRPKPLGRGDLQFLHGTGKRKPYPYFLIEAKRLHVSFPSRRKSLVPEYVTGTQGMKCFTDERYSRNLASGAMLGYVFDGRIQEARDAVHEMVVKHAAKLQSVVPHGLSGAGIPGTTAEQSHHCLSGRDFLIYHLFVSV